jgi:hypothetical protein
MSTIKVKLHNFVRPEQKRNYDVVNRNIQRVEKFLLGIDTNDGKCFALTGTNCQSLKYYFEKQFGSYSWDNYNKEWHIGFHISPYGFDMTNRIQKGCNS